jgi:HTH-type transcriptional regulator / antitoxin HigA
METLTVALDEKRYGRLLSKVTPRVIKTASEHDRALMMAESLLRKGERRLTAEEAELLDLLTNLIQDYEAREYPPREKAAPHEVVAFLLEQRGLSAKDLWPVVGSRSRVSEILSAKRTPSKQQALKLAAFFGVSVELFL